jgi:nucleoid-associated protein YgaU
MRLLHKTVYRHRRRWFMGRDKVLGLSLAILVIGFAAAFCFRNEAFVESGLKLARSKILDEKIAQLSGPKPYIADAKPAREKPTLPTVTLQGIQSIDPFADLQGAQSAVREQPPSVERTKQIAHAKTASLNGHVVTEPKTPTSDIPTSIETETASIDTEKAAPEINTSKPGTAPAFPVVEKSNASSELLTSAAPPADSVNDQKETASNEAVGNKTASKDTVSNRVFSNDTATNDTATNDTVTNDTVTNDTVTNDTVTNDTVTNDTISTDTVTKDMIIRPNAPSRGRNKSVFHQNVAWPSANAEPDHGKIADQSPSSDSPPDSSSIDDPHRNMCTRNNPTRDLPGAESATDETAPHENPATLNPTGDTPSAINPSGGNPDVKDSTKSQTHRVRRGDTLTKIALHYLGDSRRYREIFEANRDQLHTPNDRLKIGLTLRIPKNTATPARAGSSVVKRKSRSNRSSQGAAGTSPTAKVPIRNVASVREKPSGTPADAAPAGPSEDEGMNSDKSSTIRFVPVRKAPFLPGSKPQPDQQPPVDRQENMPTDMSHYRSFTRPAPITIAGDREDATIR